MSGQPAGYIPALGLAWLTPLYDPVMRWVLREAEFKSRLIAQAGLRPGQRVLDLGCGTGTLTLMIKQACPEAEVIGLDGDPAILAIARAKSERAGLAIRWEHGLADHWPHPDAYFDRVLSSLVFHHLPRETKQAAAREAFRTLRPGGELHVADFGQPQAALERLVSRLTRHLERVDDNQQGLLPEFFRQAGLEEAAEVGRHGTLLGALAFYRAARPPKAEAVGADAPPRR